LPHRAEAGAYVRPPMSDQTFVPDVYPGGEGGPAD